MTVNIIQLIIAKLEQYPQLKYKVQELRIEVEPPNQEGYGVSLEISDNGFTIYFDGWHETFVEEQEALNCFIYGFSNKARLKVHKKGNTEYKWTLQYKNETDWQDESTTGLLIYPFWQKDEILFKQNNLNVER